MGWPSVAASSSSLAPTLRPGRGRLSGICVPDRHRLSRDMEPGAAEGPWCPAQSQRRLRHVPPTPMAAPLCPATVLAAGQVQMEGLATGPSPAPLEPHQTTTSWCARVRPGTASLHPDPLPGKLTEPPSPSEGVPRGRGLRLSAGLLTPASRSARRGWGSRLHGQHFPPTCPAPLIYPRCWSCPPGGPWVLTWPPAAATSATSGAECSHPRETEASSA